MFAPQEPDPALGGLRFIDVFVPSLIVITVGTLGIQTLPIRLATYREKGVLRRLSTTPAHPLRLLAAQLVIYMVTAVIALVLLVVVANVVFGVPLPRQPIGYLVAFLLGMTLAVRDRAPARGRRAVEPGRHGPRDPDVLRRHVPRRGLPAARVAARHPRPDRRVHARPASRASRTRGWGPRRSSLPLLGMAVVTLVVGAVAVRLFRWE